MSNASIVIADCLMLSAVYHAPISVLVGRARVRHSGRFLEYGTMVMTVVSLMRRDGWVFHPRVHGCVDNAVGTVQLLLSAPLHQHQRPAEMCTCIINTDAAAFWLLSYWSNLFRILLLASFVTIIRTLLRYINQSYRFSTADGFSFICAYITYSKRASKAPCRRSCLNERVEKQISKTTV